MYTKEQIQKLQAITKKLLKEPGSITNLRDALRFHEHRYYVLNEPLISDFEYDQLYKNLEKLEHESPEIITPDSPTQRVGNSLNNDFVSVKQLLPMLSLDNSYNQEDLFDWVKVDRK